MPTLTRGALRRVLESLLTAEILRARRIASLPPVTENGDEWPEFLALADTGTPSLDCDSIELLWLAAAVNEMFCLYDAQVEESLLSAETFGDWLDIVESSCSGQNRRITFSTSGSAGLPKSCTHELAHLEREVRYLAERFAGTRRVIALTPPHHIYGFLFTAMLPSHLDVPVLVAHTLSPGALHRALGAGDLLVAVPPRWEWLARSIPSWPEGVHGVTSTAPLPERLKLELVGAGLQQFTEVYGSSETAGVGLRTYPATRYTLMPYWTWSPAGEESPSLSDSEGYSVTLQDHLDIAPDGTFLVKARIDGAVQVGGVNVYPKHLENLLRTLPGVAEASVRLGNGAGSERLKAFVVPQANYAQATLAEELERWAAGFPAPERIRSFTFGVELPATAMGKPADWDIPPAEASPL